jgi:hypothetical protein
VELGLNVLVGAGSRLPSWTSLNKIKAAAVGRMIQHGAE